MPAPRPRAVGVLPPVAVAIAGIFSLLPVQAAWETHIVRRHDVEDRVYLDLAANRSPFLPEAGYPDFRPVCAIADGSSWRGSGTLVSPYWVVTAAHLFVESKTDVVPPATQVRVTFASEDGQPDQHSHQAAAIVLHPLWAADPEVNYQRGIDLALIRLAEPVLDRTPAGLGWGGDALGQLVYFAGFGNPGTGTTGDFWQSPRRRAGSNQLDRLLARLSLGDLSPDGAYRGGLLAWDFDHPQGTVNSLEGLPRVNGNIIFSLGTGTSAAMPTLYEATSGPGDSGGAAFLQVDGRWRLAGVISWGVNDSTYGDITVATRCTDLQDWILAQTQYHPVESFWRGVVRLSPDGWFWREHLGFFHSGYFPWLYLADGRWWYLDGPGGQSVTFLFDPEKGWLALIEDFLPFVYSFHDQQWLVTQPAPGEGNV